MEEKDEEWNLNMWDFGSFQLGHILPTDPIPSSNQWIRPENFHYPLFLTSKEVTY